MTVQILIYQLILKSFDSLRLTPLRLFKPASVKCQITPFCAAAFSMTAGPTLFLRKGRVPDILASYEIFTQFLPSFMRSGANSVNPSHLRLQWQSE